MATKKIVAISDMHGLLPEIPECDILLIAGDITPATNHNQYYQAEWLDSDFRRWLNRIPAKKVVGIAGNHDFVFMTHPERVPKDLRWLYLECKTVEVDGIKIFGSPWSNWFYDWAFNAPKENGEEWLETKIYNLIQPDTDIIISHGPPYGGHPLMIQDSDYTLPYKSDPRKHVGSTALLKRCQEIKPKYLITGHIHCGYGRYDINLSPPDEGVAPQMMNVVNASVVNEKYRLANEPIVIDYEIAD